MGGSIASVTGPARARGARAASSQLFVSPDALQTAGCSPGKINVDARRRVTSQASVLFRLEMDMEWMLDREWLQCPVRNYEYRIVGLPTQA